MKLITTNSRMKLKQEGYPCALRFDTSYDKKAEKIERWLHDRYGSKWAKDSQWYSMLGSPRYSDGEYSRPYYIGLRTQELATLVMLAMS